MIVVQIAHKTKQMGSKESQVLVAGSLDYIPQCTYWNE